MVGCEGASPDAAQLRDLVARGATRTDVARELGNSYILYDKKDPEMWKALEKYWEGEPSDLRVLREKAERYRRVMYCTTAWTTAWVFLDKDDIARDYRQGTQQPLR